MRQCRLYWAGEHGWLLEVPAAITDAQLARVAQWALPRQIDRYRALPPSDKKEELGRAIDLLKQNKVSQRVIDHDRDGIIVPFAATERQTTTEYSFG